MRHLPNILCWSRIALTPVCVWLLLTGHCGLAVPVTLFTGFTDLFDGLLARRLGVESRFGAWLDPVADKILLTSLYISFGIGGAIPQWLVWLVVGRDVVILGMVAIGLLFTQIRDFPPTIWGKLSTVIQIGGVLVLLAGCASWETTSILRELTVWTVTIATAWSGVHYVWRGGVMLRASR